MSIDTLSYEPESVIDDEVDDDKFEELNFFVMHDYEDYNED